MADSAPNPSDLDRAILVAASAGMILGMGPSGLELLVSGERPGTGVRGEIESSLARRLDSGHPLRRIVSGLADTPGPVIDATAGLGGDAAIVAASSSRQVMACERHPVVAALLEDGQRRAIESGYEPATRIKIHRGDAIEFLAAQRVAPSLVMLDPMYPPRRKSSALPPKPMQRLRSLLGEDQAGVVSGIVALLVAAETVGAARIVLKRPPDVPTPESPLGPPTFEIPTKLLRWSVWERRTTTG